MTTISIVTTSLNQAPFLEEMLCSVQSQAITRLEHIVMDGGSTDGSVSILQSKVGPAWQHLRWQSKPDGGQSEAMNQGFRLATGDVIGWLNSDDRYRPGCFDAVLDAFAANPDIDIFYGDYTFIDPAGRQMCVRREIEFNRFVLFYHRVLYIPTTSTFFRKRIFEQENWLDESLHYAMDHEFFLRLAARGYRFKHLPALLADFRLHASSKTCTRPDRQLQESHAAIEQHARVFIGFSSPVLTSLCIRLLQTVAAAVRYTEKLLRGYYLPDSVTQRFRLTRQQIQVGDE